MIVAEAGAARQTSLRDTCEGIARSIRLAPSPLAPDAETIEQRGREIVRQIASKGLDHWWRPAKTESWFRLSVRGDPGFAWQFRRRARSKDGRTRYEGGTVTHLRLTHRKGTLGREDMIRWSIDADTVGFAFKQWMPSLGKEDKEIRLSDDREAGSRQVRHFIAVGAEGAEGHQGALTTPENFLPDPIFELALHQVAQRPVGETVMFAGVGSSPRMLLRRICRSLGRLSDEDDGQGGPAFGVLVRVDYEPDVTRYVLDAQGQAVRSERGKQFTGVLASRSEVEDHLGAQGASLVAKSLERWETARWLGGAGESKIKPAGTRPRR
jgi:hypothetical protein